MNENDNERVILDKIKFFLNSKTNVHIKKKNKTFLNGVIFEQLEEKVFLMKDKELGIVHLFVSEVYDLCEFTEKEE